MRIPDLYFRRTPKGATVLRVSAECPAAPLRFSVLGRIRDNKFLPAPKTAVHAGEQQIIWDWIAHDAQRLSSNQEDTVRDLADTLNLTTEWLSHKASGKDVADASDVLLLAMQDMRQVLVRRLGKMSDNN